MPEPIQLRVAIHKELSRSRNGSSNFVLDVDFIAHAGVTVIFGPSGAGKTTLLDSIAGLIVPDAGKIALGIHQTTQTVETVAKQDDNILFDSDQGINLPPQARGLGYVFQTLALFPHLTAQENIAYGLNALSNSERRQRISEMLDSFHISHLANKRPDSISGGERQRVALARSLVTRPRALLLDEPLSALDYTIKSKIMTDLLTWNQQHPIPVLYVSHAIEEVFTLGDHAIVLRHGRIEKQGRPSDVLFEEREQLMRQLR
jgi:molybdate transport system ATP-binding protein